MYTGQIADMLAKLIELEQGVAAAAVALDDQDEIRVYEWRPHGPPELPAIWNWIDDGSYEIDDTARATDVLVMKATIGVMPSDIAESMGRLVRLTDVFRSVVDPALWQNQPLDGTTKRAKRVVTRTGFDTFDGIPVMCMDMLIRVELPRIIA